MEFTIRLFLNQPLPKGSDFYQIASNFFFSFLILGYYQAGFELEFSQEMQDRIAQIDFTPVVLVEDVSVTVRFVTFTKWGGFFENVYVMDISDPMQLLDVQFNPLIEYDCGINF